MNESHISSVSRIHARMKVDNHARKHLRLLLLHQIGSKGHKDTLVVERALLENGKWQMANWTGIDVPAGLWFRKCQMANETGIYVAAGLWFRKWQMANLRGIYVPAGLWFRKWQMANLRGIDVPAGLWYGGRSLQQHGTLPTWQGGEEDYVRSHIWDLSSLVIYLVRCQTCFQDLKVDMNDQQRLERKSKATPALMCSSFSICRRRCEMWDVPKTGCIVIVPDDAV